MTNLDRILKSRDITVPKKGPSSQSYGLSSSHVWMWELDYKESWANNWCFWTVVLEKTLESPLDYKEIQPVHSKGDQSWVFFGRNDAKAATPTFGHLMRRVDSLEETLMLGGIGGRRRRGWRGWDGWMVSRTLWMRVWVHSGSWWWTERPGMLQFMGSQRVGHDWVTEKTNKRKTIKNSNKWRLNNTLLNNQ